MYHYCNYWFLEVTSKSESTFDQYLFVSSKWWKIKAEMEQFFMQNFAL